MKSPKRAAIEGLFWRPTTSSITSDRFESISFANLPFFFFAAFLQLLLELPPNAQWGTRNGEATDRKSHADLMAKLHGCSASPPCSPQIADLSLGRVLRPCSMPQHINMPTPLVSSDWKWIRAEYSGFLLVHVIGQEAAGVRRGKDHGGLREVVGFRKSRIPPLPRFLAANKAARGKLDHGSRRDSRA